MRRVVKPKEPRGRVRFLSSEERERLLSACKASQNKFLYPVVILGLATGMRKGEIMNLRWQDVDFQRGRITLQQTKNGERRAVPLVGYAMQVLQDFRKLQQIDMGLLFPSKEDSHKPMDLRAPWEKALRISGIKAFTFHCCRHSCASELAMNGASLVDIKNLVTSITNSEELAEYGLWDLAKNSLKLPWTATKLAWKGLRKVSEKLYDATKLIEFKKSYDSALKRGLLRSQALTQAAHDAFEVSVPYGRQGNSAALQEMYKIVPFMRTIVNSGMTFAQTMDPRNPRFPGMLATALAALTLPALYFYSRNRNDERYQRIPQEDRDRNIYIYNTDDPNEEPIKIRKLWQYGFVFQALPERVMEFLAQKDPKAFEKLAKNFEYEFSPFTMLSFSSAIEDGFHPEKVFEGHKFSIIPEKQRRIDASLQHTASTSEVAQKLGALTNVSPIYVDFIINQTGGGLGKNVARLMDEAIYFTGMAEDTRPEGKHADNVLWGTFFGRGPSKASEYLNRFYKLHDKMQMTKSTIKQLEKEGKFEEAAKYAKAHPFVETTWMRTRLGSYYKQIDEILAKPVKGEEERRKKRIELDKLYIDMAKHAQSYGMTIEKNVGQSKNKD